MKVLVACEFSGVVREAFRAVGHDAWSIDLIPTEIPGQHIVGDVTGVLNDGWDMMIAHPPCTHLAVSGARWWPSKAVEQAEALDFVRLLLGAPIKHIALENPIGKISTAIRKPDQIIQPYQFGHAELKATCLWLKNLPPLEHTSAILKEFCKPVCWLMPDGKNQAKNRSRTYTGIAEAMAAQWGSLYPVTKVA